MSKGGDHMNRNTTGSVKLLVILMMLGCVLAATGPSLLAEDANIVYTLGGESSLLGPRRIKKNACLVP